MTVRWVFTDLTTAATYTVPLNPNVMTSPYPQKAKQPMPQFARSGQGTAIASPTLAFQWTFGGSIRSQAHHDALAAWAAKEYPVTITDHYGRIFVVVLQHFQPDEKRPSKQFPWKFNYTMVTLMLERLA